MKCPNCGLEFEDQDELGMIYREYGFSEDDALTEGAVKLKRLVLKHVSECPSFSPVETTDFELSIIKEPMEMFMRLHYGNCTGIKNVRKVGRGRYEAEIVVGHMYPKHADRSEFGIVEYRNLGKLDLTISGTSRKTVNDRIPRNPQYQYQKDQWDKLAKAEALSKKKEVSQG